MNKYRKPKFKVSELGDNPFLEGLKVRVTDMKLEDQWKKDRDGIMLPARMQIEALGFCKFFVDVRRRSVLKGLTLRGKELLLFMMVHLEAGQDWLWVNKVRYMEETGMSSYNTYNGAVNDLIRNGYISRVPGPPNVFFINPDLFFSGNRMKKFPKQITRK